MVIIQPNPHQSAPTSQLKPESNFIEYLPLLKPAIVPLLPMIEGRFPLGVLISY